MNRAALVFLVVLASLASVGCKRGQVCDAYRAMRAGACALCSTLPRACPYDEDTP
jgi:hypothetical protein